jgi:hypothetical protein
MINKNMDMIKQMNDLLDYDEYVSLCKTNKVEPRELRQFIMGVGALLYARNKWPDMDWQEAYTKAHKEIRKQQGLDAGEKKGKKGCKKQKEKQMPSLLQKGKNFAKAATEHIKSGRQHADKNEYLRRLNICGKCNSLTDEWDCMECGCKMKIKAGWLESECSLNKW